MLILATVETAHFYFTVIAVTREEAHDALLLAWGRHQRQTGAAMSFAELEDSIVYHKMQIGQVYRDGIRV
jgi:hypothetical protein